MLSAVPGISLKKRGKRAGFLVGLHSFFSFIISLLEMVLQLVHSLDFGSVKLKTVFFSYFYWTSCMDYFEKVPIF
jgi:hypothetical protein